MAEEGEAIAILLDSADLAALRDLGGKLDDHVTAAINLFLQAPRRVPPAMGTGRVTEIALRLPLHTMRQAKRIGPRDIMDAVAYYVRANTAIERKTG